MIPNYKALLLALFALVAISGHAHAQSGLINPNTQERYRVLRNAPSESHSDVAVVSSASWATPTNPTATVGCLKIAVSGEFELSGGTLSISLGLYHFDNDSTYTLLGVTSQTITGGSSGFLSADGTMYLGSNILEFDTLSATTYDVRITAMTTGGRTNSAVNVTHWRVGHSPE